MTHLIQQYARTGILQFGRFRQPDNTFAPMKTNFLMLPSYPDVLKATAQALIPMVQQTGANRLLATRDAIPLGAVLAAETGIPLTYQYGKAKAYTVAYTIEGAYDVGHPTTLITNVLHDDLDELMTHARQVGLDVIDVVCVLAMQAWESLPVHSLLKMETVLTELVASGALTEHMHTHVTSWLTKGK